MHVHLFLIERACTLLDLRSAAYCVLRGQLRIAYRICVLRIWGVRSVAYCVSRMRIAYYVFGSNYRAIGIYTYGGCFTTITRLVCKNSAISAHASPRFGLRPPFLGEMLVVASRA